MNSAERIFATMRGEPVDRHAFAPILSLYGAKLTGCALDKYYSDSAEYVRGQDAVYETFEPDMLLGSFCLAPIGGSFGGKVKLYSKDAPNLVRPAISSPRQITEIKVPDVDRDPAITYITEGIRLLAGKYKSKVPVAGIALSPIDIAIMIMGMDGWLETVMTDENAAKRVLDITTPFFVQWLNAMFDAGAFTVFLPTVFFNPIFIPKSLAVKYALPALSEAFAQLNGPVIIHDTGAPILEFLDIFYKIPNVAGFAVNNKEPLELLREKISDNKVLACGIDCYEVKQLSPLEIYHRTIKMLDNRKYDRRFIVSSSGADINFDTPIENITAIKKAVEEYGGWTIR